MVSVGSSIHDIDPWEWNRLAGDNAFAAHGWLLTAERCWRARCEPRYFTLRDGGALVGAAVCYVMRSSAGVETLDDVLLGRLRSKAARVGFSFLPALVCGPAQGYGWHIGVDPALDPAARGQVLRRMLDAIEAEADRLALPLSFLQVLDEETDLRALLSARRYLASENVPVAVLDVPWKSLDEYFESLPRRYRKKFRRESRRNIEAGCTTEILGSCAELHQRLMELLDDNARRHGSDGAAFRPEALRRTEKNMGDAAVLLAARKQGAVSGVCVALRQDAALIAYAVGVDQELGGDDFTYFQILYYKLIERAMELGLERIYYGRGMYAIKLRRGCRTTGAAVHTRVKGARRLLWAAWYAFASAWIRRRLRASKSLRW